MQGQLPNIMLGYLGQFQSIQSLPKSGLRIGSPVLGFEESFTAYDNLHF